MPAFVRKIDDRALWALRENADAMTTRPGVGELVRVSCERLRRDCDAEVARRQRWLDDLDGSVAW